VNVVKSLMRYLAFANARSLRAEVNALPPRRRKKSGPCAGLRARDL